MLRKAWRIRAWGSWTSVLVAGSMPCIPATKTKSPARVPRLQVPSALMAPEGLSVLTPLGDGDCAEPGLDATTAAVTQRTASRCNISFLCSRSCARDESTRDQESAHRRVAGCSALVVGLPAEDSRGRGRRAGGLIEWTR